MRRTSLTIYRTDTGIVRFYTYTNRRYRSIDQHLDIAVPTTDSSMPNIGLAYLLSSIAKRCLAILKYRLIDTIPNVAFTTAKTTIVAIFNRRGAVHELSNGPWFSSY